MQSGYYGSIKKSFPDNSYSKKNGIPTPKQCFPIRYMIVLMASLGIMVEFTLRYNLSMAIVAMVKQKEPENAGTDVADCPGFKQNFNSTDLDSTGDLEWDSRTQGIVLSAFFYGYAASQVPGGIIADKLDCKWTVSFLLAVTSILNILTPLTAKFNVPVFITLRVLMGLIQGPSIPTFWKMVSRWAPDKERTTMLAAVQLGMSASGILTPLFVVWLIESDFGGGWESCFYISGIIGIVWCFLWICTVSSTPETHRCISRAEKNFIVEHRSSSQAQKRPIPWMKLLICVPAWMVVFMWFGIDWINTIFHVEQPLYLQSALKIPLKLNGILNSATSLAALVAPMIAALFSDCILNHGLLERTILRKLKVCIGGILAGLLLALVPLMKCDYLAATILFTLSNTLLKIAYVGNCITAVEVVPDFCGTVIGVGNFFGSVANTIVPMMVGEIIYKQGTLLAWSKVFYISGAIVVGTSVAFAIFGSAEPRPWAVTSSEGEPTLHNSIKRSKLQYSKSISDVKP